MIENKVESARMQANRSCRKCSRTVVRWLLAVAAAASANAYALDPHARFHDYVRDNWNIESGLPQISVLSITQDATGYL